MNIQIESPLKPIRFVKDVEQFFRFLLFDMDVILDPDLPFEDYVDNKFRPTFSDRESLYLNKLMLNCFAVCNLNEVDIYGIACNLLREKIAREDEEFLRLN